MKSKTYRSPCPLILRLWGVLFFGSIWKKYKPWRKKSFVLPGNGSYGSTHWSSLKLRRGSSWLLAPRLLQADPWHTHSSSWAHNASKRKLCAHTSTQYQRNLSNHYSPTIYPTCISMVIDILEFLHGQRDPFLDYMHSFCIPTEYFWIYFRLFPRIPGITLELWDSMSNAVSFADRHTLKRTGSCFEKLLNSLWTLESKKNVHRWSSEKSVKKMK